jgi:hypothetical protein
LRACAALGVLAAVIVGCGGSGSKGALSGPELTTATRGEGKQSTAPRLPRADEDAFIVIARASGSLRAGTAAVALGKAERISGRASMANARVLVADIRPRDAQLARLGRQIDQALRSALMAAVDPRSQRAAAKAALAATDAVNRGLRRYADRHPAVALLVPD